MSTINPHVEQHAWAPPTVPPPIVPPPGAYLSEQQFESWAFAQRDVRAEWVEGKVVVMSPVSQVHNSLSVWLTHLLSSFLEVHPLGDLYGPEFMVRLGNGKSRRVPDLLFVSAQRRNLVKKTYLDGPPDLAVEIVSEDSQSRDRREKYHEYESAGVHEYWIVDPFTQQIEAYALGDDGKYVRIAEVEGKIASTVLPGFHLRNEWLWANPRPTVRSLFSELGLA
jgi:Uma2 family endonuclease